MPEVLALAKLWDRFGLLVLHEFDVPKHYPEEQIKIFNAYKDQGNDRQIGDRRGRNAWEMRVAGPSKILPTGVDYGGVWFQLQHSSIGHFDNW